MNTQSGEKLTGSSSTSINTILTGSYINKMAEIIEKSGDAQFVGKANEIMKSLQNWLLKSSPLPYGPSEFSETMRKLWKHQCFVDAVESTIEDDYGCLMDDILVMSNEDSVIDRVACMKSDPCLKSGLMGITSGDNTACVESDPCLKSWLMNITSDGGHTAVIRLFLLILIAHWTDRKLLEGLDGRMKKKHFTERWKWMDDMKARLADFEKKKHPMDELSITVKSGSDIENLEVIRNALIKKHGEGASNMDAMVDRVKRAVDFAFDLNMKGLGYGGGKAKITLHGREGRYNLTTFTPDENAGVKKAKAPI